MIEENAEVFRVLYDAIKSARDVALVTIVRSDGSTPRNSGAKMLVYGDGSIFGTIGGGKLEARSIKDALAAMKKGESVKLSYSLTSEGLGMECSGENEVFIEVFCNGVKLLILGGGHVAQKIGEIAAAVGIPYSVADDRAEFANRERFPHASSILVVPPHKAVSASTVDGRTYVIIVTRGHSLDQECLEAALPTKAPYIGMIGSKNKVPFVFKNLNKKGLHPEKDGRVYSPIGLKIGGKTPGEIAVSVLAEILKLSGKTSGEHCRIRK